MKKNLMLFAAAAAAFGLLTVTGCEDNAGNEENNGEETADTIKKQWVASIEDATGTEGKRCFDLSVEGQIIVGDFTDEYKQLLDMYIGDYDPDNSFFAYVNGPDTVSNIEETDATSGVVTYLTDPSFTGEYEEMTLNYSNLTETSVDITYTEISTGEATTYSCTVAPEGTKVYSIADAM